MRLSVHVIPATYDSDCLFVVLPIEAAETGNIKLKSVTIVGREKDLGHDAATASVSLGKSDAMGDGFCVFFEAGLFHYPLLVAGLFFAAVFGFVTGAEAVPCFSPLAALAFSRLPARLFFKAC